MSFAQLLEDRRHKLRKVTIEEPGFFSEVMYDSDTSILLCQTVVEDLIFYILTHDFRYKSGTWLNGYTKDTKCNTCNTLDEFIGINSVYLFHKLQNPTDILTGTIRNYLGITTDFGETNSKKLLLCATDPDFNMYVESLALMKMKYSLPDDIDINIMYKIRTELFFGTACSMVTVIEAMHADEQDKIQEHFFKKLHNILQVIYKRNVTSKVKN